ncbi:MAG: O-antigen ligase family protein [Clostridia bacterium]|nr:O-antigen ligase family protein [Clostridia bacterium]
MSETKAQLSYQPMLHLNLRPFIVVGLWTILFSSPFFRGLFFQPELLTAHILTGVLFLLCVYDQVLRRDLAFRFSGLEWAMVALVAAYALSLFTAVHLRPAVGELLKVINYLMIFWITIRVVRTERDLDRVLLVAYVGALGVAVIGVLSAAGVFNFPGGFVGGRIYSTLQYPNTLGIFLGMMSVIGVALSVKTDRLLVKLFFAIGGALLITVVLGTHSRGSWVLFPFILGGFVAAMPDAYRWRAAYHMLVQVGAGLFAAKGFFNALQAGEQTAALLYLGVGLAAAVVLQVIYHWLGQWLNRDEVADATRRLVALGGVGYFCLVLALYVAYAGTAMPSSAGNLLSRDVTARAGTISGESLESRMEMNRDALRIVLDYPVTGAGGGGWNALYHQYQSYPYWSTETHNYFFQTWVEAGTVGFLAVLALWGFFIRLLVRLWRYGEQGGVWVSTWAAAVAALALGIHSAFDFDLSMAAMGILLWCCFGLVRRGAEIAVSGGGEAELAGRRGKKDRTAAAVVPASRLITVALAGTLCAAVLLVPAASFYSAGKVGAEGARALLEADLDQAAVLYETALKRDPFTASYPGDLAQIYAVKALSGEVGALEEAVRYADRAARLERYGIGVRTTNLNVSNMLGDHGRAVSEAEALLLTNPLMISNYEILARTYLAAARHSIGQGDLAAAGKYVRKVTDLPRRAEDQSRMLQRGSYRGTWLKDVEDYPGLRLCRGQAAFLLGDYETAELLLRGSAAKKDYKWESELWLTALYQRAGDEEQASTLLVRLQEEKAEAVELFAEVLALPELQ